MKIVKVKVRNYRALKDLSMDWQENLSLIIGKNNCGKTSLLSIMQTFFSESKGTGIRYDDFNLEFKSRLVDCIAYKKSEWNNTDIQGVEFFLYIEYTDNDNIANISPLLMDLDPN
ncbi:MAG: AAA family ATPase, partial [Coprococcus sp.]